MPLQEKNLSKARGRNFDSDEIKAVMDRNKEFEQAKQDDAVQPDRGTLHKTDPQENMQGPMSSPTRQAGEVFDSDEDKDKADERREERM